MARLLAAACLAAAAAAQSPEERAKAMVAQMTLEEKIGLMHGPSDCSGDQCWYVGNVPGIPRLGLPRINMNDGPQGFRDESRPGTSVAWPSALAMAATFDPAAVEAWGKAMGDEFYMKGSNIQLGPGLNVARVENNGRNFEYLSGEDPFLGARLAGPLVRGIQSKKVIACAKHWVLNNQETGRTDSSSNADERTRFEMYYPPFEAAVKAGVGAFMCSYNKIQGTYSCENPMTLGDLKDRLGFKGMVMSDWGATHSTSIMAGLDIEMPGLDFMNEQKIKAGLANGTITMEAINNTVLRIVTPMIAVGVVDEPASAWNASNLLRNVTTTESLALAEALSAASTVLLKNEGGVLPLKQGQRLAVIGLADAGTITHGEGSGRVAPAAYVTPLSGLQAAAGSNNVKFDVGTDLASAAAAAAAADVAIVFAGTYSSEGSDRDSLSLDWGCDPAHTSKPQCTGNNQSQNALIEAVVAANPKTVVVVSSPGAILLPWSGKVAAVLANFMPGQQVGGAIAKVLFGEVNPAARLPVTFPNKENEVQFSPEQWPGDQKKEGWPVLYSEQMLIGYRYYDAKGISFSTGFPFGHGLSYTTFEYSNLFISDIGLVTFQVANTGGVAGAEVAQLYLGFPQEAGEAPWQLKGFAKTSVLSPGDVEEVAFQLVGRDLSIWDADVHAWKQVFGDFKVKIGSSSRDVRLEGILPQSPVPSVGIFV